MFSLNTLFEYLRSVDKWVVWGSCVQSTS